MGTAGRCVLLMLVWFVADADAKVSTSEDVPQEGGASLFPPTPDTIRRGPEVTTIPPLNLPNRHTLYGNAPQHRPVPARSYGHADASTPPPEGSSGTPNDNTDQERLSTTSRRGSAGEGEESLDVKLSSDEGTTTTTITTTTVITTMQSPAACQLNLTGPEGFIEAPPPSGSSFLSTTDCSYAITVSMGYGVEVQVMNVNLSVGDRVVLEDEGRGESSMLANETILMRGLVVRSHSNQLNIGLHSSRPESGKLLLRYQAFVLSCPFPPSPSFGEVSVSSLHSGGQAFFSCLTGYRLQGPRVLTCRNATTPYWSGKEPRCLAACGGLLSNVSVGRIVSPGFPSNYSNNLTCHWLLQAPSGHRLHVHFEKVALAEDDDRLVIKNGNSIDASVLYDSYEVEYLPNEGLLSSSRFLFIVLTTDATGTSTGIAIRYQAFAPGHCYEPFVKYGNMTCSDLSWAVGAVVEFSCDAGYTLEQGSVTIECTNPDDPQWNDTEPACRAVCSGEITDSVGVVLSPNWPEAYDRGQDCIWGIHVEEDKRLMLDIQVLNIGVNDLLTFYDGDDLTAKVLGSYGGSKTKFKLYTSTADVTIQFQSDPATNVYGYGNGFVVHFFEVARNDTCPELPEISNGWKSSSHPELVQGTVVTYQCYPGFQLEGAELLMCQWDLTWSGDLPTCQRVVSCPDPGKVDHSRRVLSSSHFSVGSSVQYVCDKGFSLQGNSLLTCYSRGSGGPRWSQRLPTCTPETLDSCAHPGTPTFGVPSSRHTHFQPGDKLRYSCLKGHQLLGEPVLHCIPGHPSQWSGLPPVCKARSEDDERRLDVSSVSSASLRLGGAQVLLVVFVPVALILLIIAAVYVYFFKVQRSPLRLTVSKSPPYQNISDGSANDGSLYDATDRREYEVSI